MRLRAFFAPDFEYLYLVDVAAAHLAAAVVEATEKPWQRRRYEKALRQHLGRMHAAWPRTLPRSPRWDGTAIRDLRFDDRIGERERLALLVEAAFATPLDTGKRELTGEERRIGLRGLAVWLGLRPGWGDQVFETRESALELHRANPRGVRAALVERRPFRRTVTSTVLDGLDPSEPESALIRLQVHIVIVDGWGADDHAAMDQAIHELATRRAELQQRADDGRLSQRERDEAAVAAAAVDRTVDWLVASQQRMVQHR